MLASHIDGIKIIKPKFDKGEFSNYSDVYSENLFSQELEIEDKFIIDHQVTYKRGTVRGLYYQIGDSVQSYLIRCIKGVSYCVFVDIRIDSETYGEHFALKISDRDQLQIYASQGFAIGFVALSDESTILLKTNAEWDSDNCEYIKYDDPDLGINWIVDNEDVHYLNDNAKDWDTAEKI